MFFVLNLKNLNLVKSCDMPDITKWSSCKKEEYPVLYNGRTFSNLHYNPNVKTKNLKPEKLLRKTNSVFFSISTFAIT